MLLVEDEEVVRNFAARALKRQGYKVLEAGKRRRGARGHGEEQGQDRHRRLRRGHAGDGRPHAAQRAAQEEPRLKIIFVSGYPNDAFKASLGDEEFAFLPKPFSLPQLAAKVKEELAR